MSRATQILYTWVGATARPLQVTLKTLSGVLDVSSEAITVTLTAGIAGVKTIDGKTCTKVVVGENDAGEDGVISYTPGEGELDQAGDYMAQFELATVDGEDTFYNYSEIFIIRARQRVIDMFVTPEPEE